MTTLILNYIREYFYLTSEQFYATKQTIKLCLSYFKDMHELFSQGVAVAVSAICQLFVYRGLHLRSLIEFYIINFEEI